MSNESHKRKSSMGFGERMMWTAGVLFCLVLITTSMMGGLFARYTATEIGSDSARVAKFGNLTLTEKGDFVGTADTKTAIIIPGVDLNKKVTLSFNASEVATIVFVEVSAPNWTVLGDNKTTFTKTYENENQLSWYIADGWTYLPETQYVYYKVLEPNKQLTDVDIIRDGKIAVSEKIQKSNIQSLDGLKISFRASVIQNDGSLTPKTAWEKLK